MQACSAGLLVGFSASGHAPPPRWKILKTPLFQIGPPPF